MTFTDNDVFGPGALIISCCFPAKRWWETETQTRGINDEAERIHRQLGVGRLPPGVVLAGVGNSLLADETVLSAL